MRSARQQPSLAELLGSYYTGRNAGASSSKTKVGDINQHAEIINLITAQNLYTPDGLEARLDTLNSKIDGMKSAMKIKSTRMRELDELLRMVENYADEHDYNAERSISHGNWKCWRKLKLTG